MPSKAKIPEQNSRFGEWYFIEEVVTGLWLCRCSCGAVKKTQRSHLVAGKSTSCGHDRVEKASTSRRSHGDSAGTKIYYAWRNAKSRCYNAANERFGTYGARGITMYGPWLSDFAAFKSYVGEPPTKKHTLGRIDNDKGYFPGNVEWQTHAEQSRNKTSNHLLTYLGRTQTLVEWAEELNIDATVIRARLSRLKWSVDKALSTQTRKFY